MSATPATVRVVATDPTSQGGFVVINEADFDPAVHQLFGDAVQATETAPKRGRKPAAAPATETNSEGA